MEIAWGIVAAVCPLLVGAGISVLGMTPPEFMISRGCFILAATVLAGMGLFWELRTGQPFWWRVAAGVLIWGCSGVGLAESLRWVSYREIPATPSLMFIFGVPLGDNDSSTWLMVPRHYGPSSAYNCHIDFYDRDRKNIEHRWLVAHPDLPFPPRDLVGELQRSIFIQEAGPEGAREIFEWTPLDPDRQHYTASITCRDGIFEENWEVARVEGTLRSKITIQRGPDSIRKIPS